MLTAPGQLDMLNTVLGSEMMDRFLEGNLFLLFSVFGAGLYRETRLHLILFAWKPGENILRMVASYPNPVLLPHRSNIALFFVAYHFNNDILPSISCLLTQTVNQPIAWQQRNVLWNVDVQLKTTCWSSSLQIVVDSSKKMSSEQQLHGGKCPAGVRDQRKATVTQITSGYSQALQNWISERTTNPTSKQFMDT